jgi:hypothetical protein
MGVMMFHGRVISDGHTHKRVDLSSWRRQADESNRVKPGQPMLMDHMSGIPYPSLLNNNNT